jgi:hypothetical protein
MYTHSTRTTVLMLAVYDGSNKFRGFLEGGVAFMQS